MRIYLGTLLLLAGLMLGGAPSHAQTSKSITVALAHEPDRLYNPTTLAGQLAANLVFDPLVGLDDQMNPYPVLAVAIPSPDNSLVRLSGDGADRRLIVTLPLRQDVTWSDGEPFTADDVVFTWQLMMNPQSASTRPSRTNSRTSTRSMTSPSASRTYQEMRRVRSIPSVIGTAAISPCSTRCISSVC